MQLSNKQISLQHQTSCTFYFSYWRNYPTETEAASQLSETVLGASINFTFLCGRVADTKIFYVQQRQSDFYQTNN